MSRPGGLEDGDKIAVYRGWSPEYQQDMIVIHLGHEASYLPVDGAKQLIAALERLIKDLTQ